MSTQSDHGMEFSILPEESQQHFRLLELPAEILQLLTSANPPSLHLKSTDSTVGNNNVVLCTPTKTYDLRQVSTSNSVFIAQPTFASDGPDSLPRPQLQAIAQPQSTLEVIKPTQISAVPYIAALLPTYTSTGHYSQKDKISKEDLFANIPLSDAECEAGWTELACFELNDDRCCVIPSASVKLKAWEAMLRAATAKGIDFASSTDADLVPQIAAAEEDLPTELFAAVFKSMMTLQSHALDPELCAKGTGTALLKDLTDTSKGSVPLATFNGKWSDLLPEKWRAYAKLKCIEGSYQLDNGGKNVSFVENSLSGAAASNGAAKPEAKSTIGAKRKWHEKFRAAKKTA